MTAHNQPQSQQVYQTKEDIVIEGFDDGALALKVSDRALIELNLTAYDVLLLTDGVRNLAQVADALAEQYEISPGQAHQDVTELYQQLLEQELLEPVLPSPGKDRLKMTDANQAQYICNPDVVLREEDEDGGLLFNPDTNQVKVVNATGLFIWERFTTASTVEAVVSGIQHTFEDVPADEVAEDVQAFLDEMVQTGFIGTLETE